MRYRHLLPATAAMLLSIAACITAPTAAADTTTPYAQLLQNSRSKIQHLFGALDKAAAAASARLAVTGITGAQADRTLEKLRGTNPHIFDCVTVDPHGVIAAVAPKRYANVVGADISDQEQVKRLHATKAPVISRAIDTVEGFQAFDLEHPILDGNGKLIGSVSILTEPDFFGQVIRPTVKAYPVEMWVMQTDGRILYDLNPEEIGRNLFTDPLYTQYPSLVAVGRKMAATRQGRGRYRFLDKKLNQPVEKELLWTTIELHGTEFRLALAHEI